MSFSEIVLVLDVGVSWLQPEPIGNRQKCKMKNYQNNQTDKYVPMAVNHLKYCNEKNKILMVCNFRWSETSIQS